MSRRVQTDLCSVISLLVLLAILFGIFSQSYNANIRKVKQRELLQEDLRQIRIQFDAIRRNKVRQAAQSLESWREELEIDLARLIENQGVGWKDDLEKDLAKVRLLENQGIDTSEIQQVILKKYVRLFQAKRLGFIQEEPDGNP